LRLSLSLFTKLFSIEWSAIQARCVIYILIQHFPPFLLVQVRTEPRPLSHGSQEYQETPQQLEPVGQSIVHQSARLQVTGEAKYLDDMPMPVNGYHAVVVLSTKPHARLTAVDATTALQTPGAVAFISAKDLPAGGSNVQGDVIHDEELFVHPTFQFFFLCVCVCVRVVCVFCRDKKTQKC
jgi:xanthine dehydrogenase/oxidase